MRVVSMVPSWTETLLKSGIDVVGRTRFCIHPPQKITNIPIVGGTKEAQWELVADLKPDLVILDKEENPLEMAEECPREFLATHVTSLETLQKELARLGEIFKNPNLMELSVQCLDVVEAPNRTWNFQKIPGFQEWIRPASKEYENVGYMIWKKPWMSVSKETYIASVMEKLGAKIKIWSDDSKYPVVDEDEMKSTFLLFSSEPYPFHRKIADLKQTGLEGAIVNGESYSWFGIRSLEFLRAELLLDSSHS